MPKDVAIRLRIRASEKKALQEAAARRGKTMSELLRESAAAFVAETRMAA